MVLIERFNILDESSVGRFHITEGLESPLQVVESNLLRSSGVKGDDGERHVVTTLKFNLLIFPY